MNIDGSCARGRKQHRVHHLLEMASRECRHRVAEGDDLALLGEPDASVPTRRGGGQDRAVRATTTAGDGAAASVEEPKLDPVIATRPRHAILRDLQSPRRRDVSAILVAVGVAEHDLLETTTSIELAAVDRIAEERLEHRHRVLEILDRLEEWRDVDRASHDPALDPPEPHLAKQHQHLEYVARVVRHAHDVRADRRRLSFDRVPDDFQRVEQFASGVRDRRSAGEQRPRTREIASQECRPRVGIEPGVVGLHAGGSEQFTDRGLVHATVLPDVERRQMQTEGAGSDERICEPTAIRDLGQTGVPNRALKQFEPGDKIRAVE